MRNSKPVLLVEDDNVDVMTFKRAFADLKVRNPLVCTENGKEAVEYLKNKTNKKPCLIVLDLNMPKMNGFEFLDVVKEDEDLKQIPVVVLTTSCEQKDRIRTFKSRAVGHIVKPTNYTEFLEAVNTINQYWTLSELSNVY